MNFQPYAISQSQMIGAYAPEQILRGKVLELLPDRTAIVRLGAKQIVAKVAAVEPPLEMGKEYLFQLEQKPNEVRAKLIARTPSASFTEHVHNAADSVTQALDLKNDGLTRKIVQFFLDHNMPVSREPIQHVRALLSMSRDLATDLQAVRWLQEKQLPLSESFFKAARALSGSDPIQTQLNQLIQVVEQMQSDHPAIQKLKAALHAFIDFPPQQAIAKFLHQIGAEKSGTLLTEYLSTQADTAHTNDLRPAVASFIAGANEPKALAILLNKMSLKQTQQQFFENFFTFVTEHSEIKQPFHAGDGENLFFTMLKKLGFDYEFRIGQQQEAQTKESSLPLDTLKGHLVAVSQNQTMPQSVRETAQMIVQKITGQQLQLAAADPFVAQFSLQIPVPHNQSLTNVSVYLESKRDRKGKLDPDSCTIALLLDLAHLKETLITLHSQNRCLSINIQNDHMDVRPFLKAGEPLLSKRLAALGYRLLSLSQSAQIDEQLKKRVSEPLTQTTYRMDVKI
ncbi:hypothetical protein [Sporolactobacillus terrae]|uniref:Flagellar hook-length control protein-like C-terminal domain-containing protein n=1 Tax=Sporolactobacillus terrae TaxID=269673 RepID=A0A5K7WY66_9BACL|nr:hypothetical protein [Sporolactobacillus terrae]BBN98644.1 hypothetical protein St703_13490 [Sporolactobacillus terrae]